MQRVGPTHPPAPRERQKLRAHSVLSLSLSPLVQVKGEADGLWGESAKHAKKAGKHAAGEA